MNFIWDERKRKSNLKKHGLDFADAHKVFSGPMALFQDDREQYGEQRWVGIGTLGALVVLNQLGSSPGSAGVAVEV